MQYVIGDVHCTYFALEKLMSKLNIDENKDIVYFVGDILDRQITKGCLMNTVKWFNDKLTNHGNCYKLVIGNHDLKYAGLSSINKSLYKYKDFKEYNSLEAIMQLQMTKEDKTEILKLCDHFAKAPLYREVNYNGIKYIITHSWIVNNSDKHYPCLNKPENADVFYSVYDRQASLQTNELDGIIVIHGHTPNVCNTFRCPEEDRGKIYKMTGNVNVDCGAPFIFSDAGNLAAYCIETQEEVYAYTDNEYDDMINHIIDETYEIEWYGKLITGDTLDNIKKSVRASMNRVTRRKGYDMLPTKIFNAMLSKYLDKYYLNYS